MTDSPLKVWLEQDGKLLRLRLNRPKANIVDAEMIGALQQTFEQHKDRLNLRAVLMDAEGPHFSFGASVEEHMPDSCAAMLRGLHRLVESMLEFPLPVLVAINGQLPPADCLHQAVQCSVSPKSNWLYLHRPLPVCYRKGSVRLRRKTCFSPVAA